MSTKITKNLTLPESSKYNLELSFISLKQAVDKNIPVTFDLSGQPVSYFNDEVWDYSSYMDVRRNLHRKAYSVRFDHPGVSELFRNEIKLICLSIFFKSLRLAINAHTLKNTSKVLATLSVNLLNQGFETFLELNESMKFYNFMESIRGKYTKSTLANILYVVNGLYKLNVQDISVKLPLNRGQTIDSVSTEYSSRVDKTQTLYIPEGVHSRLLNLSVELINEALLNENSQPSIIERVNQYFDERWSIHKSSLEIVLSQNSWISGKELTAATLKVRNENFDKSEVSLTKFGLEKLKINGGKGAYTYVNNLAAACYVVISSFTGMRYDEISSMKENCFNKTVRDGVEIYYLTAYESKISGGQTVDYVTAPIVENAIKLLVKIHTPAKKHIEEFKNNDFLLITHPTSILPTFHARRIFTRAINVLIKTYDIRVSESDYRQSLIINDNNTSVKVGDLWNASTHQFRRTLIVNFLTHGLAGVTQVKQQVKHMYASMTEYYGKNHEFATVMRLRQDKNFVKSLEEENVKLKVHLYKRLHYSNEHLEGVKGRQIQNGRGCGIILSDIEIAHLIKSGQWAVTRTPFGYCTKGDRCDKSDVVDPSFCGAACETNIITEQNAINWQKLYIRNKKILFGLLEDGFESMRDMLTIQNSIAVKIMDSFGLKY